MTYRGSYRKVIPNVFSDARDLPLVSIGSPDRRHVTAQAYDTATQAWGPPETVYVHGFRGCTAQQDYTYAEPTRSVHAVELHCYTEKRADGDYPPFQQYGPAPQQARLLTSSDGVHWTVTNLSRRPYGISRSGSLLAAPGPHATTVVSPAGTTRLPVTAPGPCDFVFPIGPESLLRLHGGQDAAWPTELQKSESGGAWQTIQRVRMPSTGSCARIEAQHDPLPSVFFLRDRHVFVGLIVRRGGVGGWHVERYHF